MRAARTATLEKRLISLTQKDLDPEIAKRLKYNLGSIDEFLDQKELTRILAEQSSIDDMYIISRIDKSGNLGSNLASNKSSLAARWQSPTATRAGALDLLSQKNSDKSKRVQQEAEFDPVEVCADHSGAQVR